MQPEFQALYDSLLQGELGKLEEQRRQFVRDFKKTAVIGAIAVGAGTVVCAIGIYLGPAFFAIPFVVLVVAAIALGVKYSRFATQFRADFKARVIPDLVRYVDERLHYEPHHSLIAEYDASQLYPRRYDRHKAEDTITGTFDKTQFSFGEVFTEYKVKTKNGTSWHTIFRGLLFVADFNKEFHGETIVDRDNMERLFGGIGRAFQKMNVSRSGSVVRLENPAFEQKFAVYSTDEQECRYILTPSLMERILQLDEKSGGQICLSFRHNSLYVAYSYQADLFEPSVFYLSLNPEKAANLIAIIHMMIGIVEDLNLNTRIWTKE